MEAFAASEEGSQVLPVCARLESEIAEMSAEDKSACSLLRLGFEESGLDRLIRECYDQLGLISYLTAGEPEVRAWTITKGHQGAPGRRQDPHRILSVWLLSGPRWCPLIS